MPVSTNILYCMFCSCALPRALCLRLNCRAGQYEHMLTVVSICCTGDDSELSPSLPTLSETAPQVIERSEQHFWRTKHLSSGQVRSHGTLWGLVRVPARLLALIHLQLRCLHSGLRALLQLPYIAQAYAPIGQQRSLQKPAARPGSTRSAGQHAADAAHMSACSGAVLATAVGIGVLSALETERRLKDEKVCSSPINGQDDAARTLRLWSDPQHAQLSMPGSRAYAGGARLVGNHAVQRPESLKSQRRQLRHSEESLHGILHTYDATAGGTHKHALAEEQEGRSIFWMHRLPAYRARMREICGGSIGSAGLGADLT